MSMVAHGKTVKYVHVVSPVGEIQLKACTPNPSP
jgi:hypothetical protein